MKQGRAHTPGQSGVTLVIVLMLLVIVTLLGVGAARIALLAERSTRNDRDYQVAWQSAEAALLDAQFDIAGPNASGSQRMALFTSANTSVFSVGCNTSTLYRGLCAPSEGKPVWASVDFLDESSSATTVGFGTYTGRGFDAGGVGVKPSRVPRYLIEVLQDKALGGEAGDDPNKPKPLIYRITAMGFGPRDDVQVVLQAAYRK